jgi:hypothetical protein
LRVGGTGWVRQEAEEGEVQSMELKNNKIYTVYRMDFLDEKKVPIGTLVERRVKERGNNEAGVLRLAQKLYAESPIDKLRIIVSLE